MKLSLSQVAEVRLGRQRTPEFAVGDHLVPYLRSANVLDGALDLRDVKSMNFTPGEQALFGLRDGDVLVTEAAGVVTPWASRRCGLETFRTSSASRTPCFAYDQDPE